MSVVPEASPRRGGISPIVAAGIALVLLTALLQGLGFCWGLERRIVRLLPSSMTPKAPRVAVLELEKGSSGEFAEMDAALALRGLEQLHPRSVTILGTVRREEGSMDFLPAMLSRFKETKGHFPVLIPVIPSSDALYAPLPWLAGNPPSSWPTLAGKSDGGSEGSFLTEADPEAGVQLFGKTATGGAGSLWWRTLLETLPAGVQSRLLLDKVLLPGNHSAIKLTASGRFDAEGSPCPHTPLDEFLLRMERREQGSNSPGFDGIWSDAFVVIGTPDDLPKAMVFQSLLEQVSLARLGPWTQATIAALCIVTLLLLTKGTLTIRLTASALITVAVIAAFLLLLARGILIPFLQVILTAVLPLSLQQGKLERFK